MPEGGPAGRGRRRLLWLVVPVVVAAGLLIGWHRVSASPRACGTCHAMDRAVSSAKASVHAGLPCLACHTSSGAGGSLRFLLSLPREALAQVSGWNVASGIMRSVPCTRCHANTASHASKLPSGATCESCHGDVAHPEAATAAAATKPSANVPHPSRYDQIHGRDATANPRSCQTCHQTRFCQACHVRTAIPHPSNWIAQHGTVERAKGAQACTLCHPTTFCAGCHGTAIPHASNWLGTHYRQLQGQSVSACYVCHARADCTTCHAQHGVHREQDLYQQAAGGG